MTLSDARVRGLKPRDKAYKIADADGLYLEVRTSGAKLWRFRYCHLGKESRISLGSYPTIGLASARTKRDEAKRLLVSGLDPAMERKRDKLAAAFKAANSFGDVAREYIEKMVADGRAEATTVKANWLLDQLKPIAAMPVADIKPIEVLAALKKLEARGKRETARRCRSFASRVFRYAVATGRSEVDPTSVLRGALAAPKVTHHAAILDPKEVGELLRSIEAYAGNAITRIACQIAPHVMMRPGELRQQVASLAGLAPVARQSGQWKGRSFIQGGRANVRRALYMPALVAARYNPDLKAKYQSLIASGKPAKVAVVTLMRKLIVMVNALIKADRLWVEKRA